MFVITVPASKPGEKYTVRMVSHELWTCDCPDHVNRSHGKAYTCKHIAKLVSSLAHHANGSEKSKSAQAIIDEI